MILFMIRNQDIEIFSIYNLLITFYCSNIKKDKIIIDILSFLGNFLKS